MLRGKSGTGKTGSARLIAAILGRPYLLLPVLRIPSNGLDRATRSCRMLAVKQRLNSFRAMTGWYTIPAGAYLALTGQENEQATTQQCIAAYMRQVRQDAVSQQSTGLSIPPAILSQL